MMKVMEYMFVFMFCSTAGWLLEFCYRSIRHKRLINPGFLVGCCLPIYGTGGMVLYFLCHIDMSFIKSPKLRVLVLMMAAAIAMTIVEFITGEISIKYYHNRLWDYSDRFLNYKGIICPLFSFIWGLCCLAFYYFIYTWLGRLASSLEQHVGAILFMGMYYGVFAVDVCYSANIMAKLRTYAMEIKETLDFENFKHQVSEKMAEMQDNAERRRRRHHITYTFRVRQFIGKYIDTETNKPKKLKWQK